MKRDLEISIHNAVKDLPDTLAYASLAALETRLDEAIPQMVRRYVAYKATGEAVQLETEIQSSPGSTPSYSSVESMRLKMWTSRQGGDMRLMYNETQATVK